MAPLALFNEGVRAHLFLPYGSTHDETPERKKHCSVDHLECIFLALHDSLWLGKDKGSIMKSAESGGTILTYG